VVNFLAEFLEIDTVHAGQHATVRYAAGLPRTSLRVQPTDRPSGTTVRFRPDPAVFSCTRVPCVALTGHLRDLTYLLSALSLTWSFASARTRGMIDCVRDELGDPLLDVAHHQADYQTHEGPISVAVALAWKGSWPKKPQVHSFANLRRTDEGEHEAGLLAGVRAFLPKQSDTRRFTGLVAAVSVILTDVHLGNPIGTKLVNQPARPAVKAATLTALEAWAERNPDTAASLRKLGK
jgi:topoisomerase-4 subunit B